MLSNRSLRYSLAACGLLLLLAVGWCAWQVWKVNNHLQDAVDHANAFQDAVRGGDTAAIERELDALANSSGAADAGTSGATWSFLSKLPLVGDDAEGVRVVSQVVHDLTVDGLEPLVAVQDQLDELLPRDGAVPIEAIVDLEGPVEQAGDALADAEAELAAEDTSGYAGRLRDQYDDLREKVANASDAMGSAQIAVDLLPGMLGQDGERNYLLVFQNNAEIRATGGLPGAVSVVSAVDGRLELARQATGASFGRVDPPALPLTSAETKLFDEVLGSYFLSSNMTPDFPRAADLWAARWEQVYPEEIAGVIAIDTVAISHILEATGPLSVGEVELTSDNVVDELLHNTYLRLPERRAQDAFFAEVALAAFNRFTDGVADPTALIAALAQATDEGRVNLRTFDEAEQSALAGTAIAGELVTDPEVKAPQINVTVNDTTGGKMSYFLRYETDINATYCDDGVQGFTGKMRLRSTATPEAKDLPRYVTSPLAFTEPGNQWVTVRIYGPVGGTIDDAIINNEPLDPIMVEQDDRPVAMFYAELKPGQTVDVAWTMKSGEGQVDAPRVRVTPSIVGGEPMQIAGAC